MKKRHSFINDKTRKVQVNLRVTNEQHKKLMLDARKRGMSQNAVIRLALDRYFASA